MIPWIYSKPNFNFIICLWHNDHYFPLNPYHNYFGVFLGMIQHESFNLGEQLRAFYFCRNQTLLYKAEWLALASPLRYEVPGRQVTEWTFVTFSPSSPALQMPTLQITCIKKISWRGSGWMGSGLRLAAGQFLPSVKCSPTGYKLPCLFWFVHVSEWLSKFLHASCVVEAEQHGGRKWATSEQCRCDTLSCTCLQLIICKLLE